MRKDVLPADPDEAETLWPPTDHRAARGLPRLHRFLERKVFPRSLLEDLLSWSQHLVAETGGPQCWEMACGQHLKDLVDFAVQALQVQLHGLLHLPARSPALRRCLLILVAHLLRQLELFRPA
jgi:hypothetical protein